MPFGEQQFENPSIPSIEKPEKIEEKEPTREKKTEPAEEIKIPEKKESTEVEDNLKLEQIRGELKKTQETETSEKTLELEKTMEERGHFSLFERVKNKVIFVNEKANIPPELKEKLELGKESPLGLFVKMAEPIKAKELSEINLETWPKEHARSAILGRMKFHNEGRFYRDIDLKGIGSTVSVVEIGVHREAEPWGLLGKKEAFYDHAMSEKFLKAGIRTFMTLGTIEPEEIFLKNKKISLKEVKEKGVIKRGFQPVIEVRAFGTKARIRDFYMGFEDDETKKLLLEDAKKMVSQEIGKDLSNDKDYLEWFANTLGRNVGLMHKNGWHHGRLGRQVEIGPHNITLDCRITDLDTVSKIRFFERKKLKEEKDLAEISCVRFAQMLGKFRGTSGSEDIVEVMEKFREGYNAVFPPQKERKLGLQKEHI